MDRSRFKAIIRVYISRNFQVFSCHETLKEIMRTTSIVYDKKTSKLRIYVANIMIQRNVITLRCTMLIT